MDAVVYTLRAERESVLRRAEATLASVAQLLSGDLSHTSRDTVWIERRAEQCLEFTVRREQRDR